MLTTKVRHAVRPNRGLHTSLPGGSNDYSKKRSVTDARHVTEKEKASSEFLSSQRGLTESQTAINRKIQRYA